MVRATITEQFEAPVPFHRMTQEFTDFANIIDTNNLEKAEELMEESVTVVGILETARTKAGIKF